MLLIKEFNSSCDKILTTIFKRGQYIDYKLLINNTTFIHNIVLSVQG